MSQVREFFWVLRRRKGLMLLVLALVVVPAVLYATRQPKVYESTAEVLVRPVDFTAAGTSDTGTINMVPELRIAESAQIKALVASKLGKAFSSTSISFSAPLNANTLVFTASSDTPAHAQAAAQAYAEGYLKVRHDMASRDLTAARRPLVTQAAALNREIAAAQAALATTRDTQRAVLLTQQINTLENELSQVNAKLVDLLDPDNLNVGQVLTPAPLPASPSEPKPLRTATLALVAGLGLALAIALLRDRLDRRLRRRDDVAIGVRAPVLATVPTVHSLRPDPARVTAQNPEFTRAFRTLRATIDHVIAHDGVKSIVITSPTSGDGKTTTVAHLGAALARGGRRVVMIAADFQRQDLRTHFAARPQQGLTDVLSGDRELGSALARVSDDLYLLDAGPDLPGSAELLSSPQMATVIDDLEQFADVVLIDASAVLTSADVLSLAPNADGTLLVVDAERATVADISEARHVLEQVGAHVVGAVLNKVAVPRFRPSQIGRSRQSPAGSGAVSTTWSA